MLIISDWHHVMQYITAQLGRIEWEIELPMLRKDPDIDGTMQKLHPWRRNSTLYRAMVANAIDRIFSKQMQRTAEELEPEDGLPALLRDFQLVLRDIDAIQARINNIVSVATALQSIEESRRAMQQNRNVTRLTYLATIFIPPTFVCGILSMVPDVTSLRTTFWIFFTIAIPVTIVAFVVADFWHLQSKLKELWPGNKKKTK
jgi:Mg2+ and Co2+ transporter CorA